MKKILRNFFSLFFLLLFFEQILGFLKIKNSLAGYTESSIILTLVLSFIKPIADTVLLPLYLVTLNLFKNILAIVFVYLSFLFSTSIQLVPIKTSSLKILFVTFSNVELGYWSSTLLICYSFFLSYKFINWLWK